MRTSSPQQVRLRKAWSRGFADGTDTGSRTGWSEGYRIGRSHAISAWFAGTAPPKRNVRVLYVTAGIGEPYPAIDQAILAGFTGLVQEIAAIGPTDSVIELADSYRPDLVLALNGVVLPAEQVAALRNKGYRTAVWFTDDPYYTDWTVNIAPRYDYVFTLEIGCVNWYRELGCKAVHYMPFAVNPQVFYPQAAPPAAQNDFCMIGTAYWNRVSYIDYLAPLLAKHRTLIAGQWWDRLQQYPLLADRILSVSWLTPGDTARYYNGAKMVINLHRTFDEELNFNGRGIPALSVNPRTFEIGACSTLQLVDARSELVQLYVPGSEIITYSSPEELRSLMEYYLVHEEERREIALRAYYRTLQNHTYAVRLERLLAAVFG